MNFSGLNVEQRKRVNIGVELAAKPELLLLLDEPTSGLDSDTAWAICKLLRKLADNGQAILCTIHQPSGTLFEMFDRLLFLDHGKTIYFGDIGKDSKVLIDYFESRGARVCDRRENPAEWLLEITGSGLGSLSLSQWDHEWRFSKERRSIKAGIELIKREILKSQPEKVTQNGRVNGGERKEFATSFFTQLWIVTRRNFQRDWRTPSYLYSKLFLTFGTVSKYSYIFLDTPSSTNSIISYQGSC